MVNLFQQPLKDTNPGDVTAIKCHLKVISGLGGRVLHQNTYTACATQRVRDFGTADLESGIRFGDVS